MLSFGSLVEEMNTEQRRKMRIFGEGIFVGRNKMEMEKEDYIRRRKIYF